MLVKFSVGNYLSFKENAIIDMSADALKEQKNYVHIPNLHNHKIQLLKSAAIYGHNSAGKSNIIKAYQAYRSHILNSFSFGTKNNNIQSEPFLLNTSMVDKPSFLESTFIIKQTKYRYGFEIMKQSVISEWLYYADGPVRENLLFSRAGLEFGDISKSWNKTSENRVEQSKAFTKSNNLFLTVLLSQENIPRIEDIAEWFKGNIILNSHYNILINSGASQIYTDENYRSIILKFLHNADLGFTSIFEKVSSIIATTGIHANLVEFLYDTEKSNFDLYTYHNLFNEKHEFVKKIEFDLLKSESSGSIKYFILSCFLAYAIKKGQLIWIDELDASLHNQLLIFLIDVFNSENNNVGGSQLIFTTHNTVMLDNELRRDQIWFVDKTEYGESSISKGHTSESPIRIDKSIEQDYRTGKLKRGVSKKINPKDLPSLFDDQISEK